MERKGDILYDLLDSETGQWETYEKVTTLPDGTPIDDTNILPFVPAYRKSGTEYFKKTSLNKGTVSIRDFGATGNGIFDDSNKLQSAISYCCVNKKRLNLEGLTIGISLNIVIESNIKILHGSIKALSAFATEAITINGDDVVFEDFVFDGNNTTNLAIKTVGINMFRFKDSEIKNLMEVAGCGVNTYGIWVQGASAKVDITGSNFENIVPIEDAIPGNTQGAARAILVGNASKVVIDRCTFDTIEGYEDGDVIQVQTAIVSDRWNDSDVTVSNCKFYNTRKRAVKLQASKCHVYNNIIHSDSIDFDCTFAGIDTFGASTRIYSNKIYLKRATCAISVGSIYHVGDVSVTDNECYLNTDNLYSDTDATSRLSFIKVSSSAATPMTNLVIHNNQFNGYAAAILFTNNTFVTSGEIKDNYFNCGGISSFGGCSASGLKINQNTFIGSGSVAGTGKGNVCLQFIDVDGVYISNNTFVGINSWHIQPQGVVGSLGLHIEENNIYEPNNPSQIVRTGLVTSGVENIFIGHATTKRLLEGTQAPVLGTWGRGDIVLNTTPSTLGALGWVCVVGGSPGAWNPINLASNQQLSLGTLSGEISISDGNTIRLDSLRQIAVTIFELQKAGFMHLVQSGASGYPTSTGASIRVQRDNGSSAGSFEIWKPVADTRSIYVNMGTTGVAWTGFLKIVTEDALFSESEITGTVIDFTVNGARFKSITANLTLTTSNPIAGKPVEIHIDNNDVAPHTVTITGAPFPIGANNEIPAGGYAHISLQYINGTMDAAISIYA